MDNLACLLKVRLTFNQIAVLLQAKPNEFRFFPKQRTSTICMILWYISNNTGIFCLFLDAFFYFLVTYITLSPPPINNRKVIDYGPTDSAD